MSAKNNSSQKKIKPKKRCANCKKEKDIGDFYVASSPKFEDGKIPICKDCIQALCINENGEIDIMKLNSVLELVDRPFYKDVLESSYKEFGKKHIYLGENDIKRNGAGVLQLYFKNISLKQDRRKTYADSVKDNHIHVVISGDGNYDGKLNILEKYNEVNPNPKYKDLEIDVEDDPVWTERDERNMKYVISTVGHDPFDGCYFSEADRKYCFNTMASYCDTDGISEDGHKLQSVIEMTILYCQTKRISNLINKQLNGYVALDNIKALTDSKAKLLDSISKIAKDNNIASNYNKNSRQGKDSLSSKMKEMEENNYAAIKVNRFDIKTAEAFKQVADISNQNIANQLTLDSSEYSDIVKEQREIIMSYESQVDELKEENRNLKNKIIDLENNKR